MKKICSIFALSSLLFAGFAAADDTNAVYSANVVGVVKYTIPAGGAFACFSLPLNPMSSGGDWLWGDTQIAKDLPTGSQVFFWENNGWKAVSKTGKFGWGADASRSVSAGEAFFVHGPSSAAAQTVSLLGELSMEETEPLTFTGNMAYDLTAANPYPVATTFVGSELAESLANGSTIFVWRNNAWVGYSRTGKFGWQSAEGLTLGVGEGIFVRKAGAGGTVDISSPLF